MNWLDSHPAVCSPQSLSSCSDLIEAAGFAPAFSLCKVVDRSPQLDAAGNRCQHGRQRRVGLVRPAPSHTVLIGHRTWGSHRRLVFERAWNGNQNSQVLTEAVASLPAQAAEVEHTACTVAVHAEEAPDVR